MPYVSSAKLKKNIYFDQFQNLVQISHVGEHKCDMYDLIGNDIDGQNYTMTRMPTRLHIVVKNKMLRRVIVASELSFIYHPCCTRRSTCMTQYRIFIF